MFGEALDQLEAALDALQGECLDTVADERLQDEIDRFHRLRARLEAESLRRAGAWNDRGLWAARGARSARAELGRRWQMGVGAAGDRLEVASRLKGAPATDAVFASGDLSYEKARLLCTAVASDVPDEAKAAFAACEASMVEAARLNTYAKVRELMAFWQAHADPEGHRERSNSKFERRGLSVSTTFEGMVAIDGLLDPETGQVVLQALEHLADQMWRDEHRAAKGDRGDDDGACCGPVGPVRTSRQQRADALGEMARLALGYQRSTDRFDGRHRPRVTAIVDVDTLTDRLTERGFGDAVAMLADLRTPIPTETAKRLVCDAGLDTMITTTDFAPLAVTDAKGSIPAAVRRAVVQRDGCCSFPGCEMPPRSCDVHHCHERRNGGKHCVANCTVLCKRHHRLVHEGDWQVFVDRSTSRPVFRDPDGNLHHADPSPRQIAAFAVRSGRPPDRGDPLPLVS